MSKVKIEYINYDPKIHRQFPVITSCKVYSKDKIINLAIEGSGIFNEIIDDVGYDNLGKYLSISFGQWHHMETGNFLSNEDFYDLDEFEVYYYEYVSALIKIYVTEDYRSCFHNDFDRKVVISFIPYKMLNFTDNSCEKSMFTYKIVT